MAAPRIKIYFENGALGQQVPLEDGIPGLLCTATAVASTFALNTPYTLRGVDSLIPLGVDATNNPHLYKTVTDFYKEAGNGAEMWLMGFTDTVKLSDMLDPTVTTRAKALINAANGRIRYLIATRSPAPGYTPTITAGMDADVALARTNAQTLAVWAADTKATPIFVLLEGYGFSGNATDLVDLTLGATDRVSIMIGDTTVSSPNAAVGLLGGRVAKNPVHVNIGRVKDGPATDTAYIGALEVKNADWESIHNKGYITFRNHVRRDGYFFNEDFIATLSTSDYSHITARRTIDKAYIIAHNTLLEKLLGELPVNADGTLQEPLVKSWQADVEKAIAADMSAKGELSADVTNPDDKGVECYINPAQVVTSTGNVRTQIRVRPYGYARLIDAYLGFQVVAA
jgi:hypothetical protein